MTVDDRALNTNVWERFLEGLALGQEGVDSFHVLEVGGGVGATAYRLARAMQNAEIESIDYTLLDINSDHIETARQKLSVWGREAGFEMGGTQNRVVFTGEDGVLTVELVVGDAFRYAGQHESPFYNAVIAQAWLDLVNIEAALRHLNQVVRPDALFYAPLHFDGITTFLPPFGDGFEEQIERLYHQSMDERSTPHGPPGGSRSGRGLLNTFPEVGASILSVGSSDWVVSPSSEGGYPADEAYFLHHILQFIENECSDSVGIEDGRLEEWLQYRRSQIESGELVYVAHHLDVLAQMPGRGKAVSS